LLQRGLVSIPKTYGPTYRGARLATSNLATGQGVLGFAPITASGVVGASGSRPIPPPAGVGVCGQSSAEGGMGIRGQIPGTVSPANTIAVYGENFSTNPGPAPGGGGFGYFGFSARGHGLVGATGTAGGGAVVGSTNGVAGAFAGIFYGQFVVVGGPKNAAVPHPDGTALAIHEKTNATLVHMQSLNAVAAAYRSLGDSRRARVYLNRAVALAEKTFSFANVSAIDGVMMLSHENTALSRVRPVFGVVDVVAGHRGAAGAATRAARCGRGTS
jgi:hypothetical protein